MGSKAGFFSRLILPQQHKHHPQAALLELQGLARGQECMLLGWCCCWVHFFFFNAHHNIYIYFYIFTPKNLAKDLGILPPSPRIATYPHHHDKWLRAIQPPPPILHLQELLRAELSRVLRPLPAKPMGSYLAPPLSASVED